MTLKCAVQTAVRDRLSDLARQAQRLQAALAADALPPFQLARLGIDVDGMVGTLERHAEALQAADQRHDKVPE